MTLFLCFKKTACILFCFFLLQSLQLLCAQSSKPNIIFILADDADYKTLSCNGGKSYYTPNIDSMAKQGMNFSQCHSSPVCSPSRCMLLTGKYNFRNYTKWGSLDTSQKTIANLFHDAGYRTACFGKWQLDGGETSIKKFGFDSYCVFNPFSQDENAVRPYKSPLIYTNGNFVSQSETKDKYGEDIFSDSVIQFMLNDQSSPFFIYYPMALVHNPCQPTPDDSDYAAWNNSTRGDTLYYPSMVAYMDKKVGQILQQLKNAGLEKNTLVIFTGDNGTANDIYEYQDTSYLFGAKDQTTEYGTHVPLIMYGPSFVNAGAINNDLIDFTDFFPTLAHLAGITIPQSFMPVDGVDFSSALLSINDNPRNFIFNYFDKNPGTTLPQRWAQNLNYKLYDTSDFRQQRFYNIIKDKQEQFPIPDHALTNEEVVIKQQLLSIINSYVIQGNPLFKKPLVLSVTDSSAVIFDSIEIDGGSTIYASGNVWDTVAEPLIKKTNFTADSTYNGAFLSNAKKLNANTGYYLRTYAMNKAGTGYSTDAYFKTLLKPPHALKGVSTNAYSFKALWNASGASNYRIDVSTTNIFAQTEKDTMAEGFDNGNIPSKGWIITSGISPNNNYYGIKAPSLQFNVLSKYIISPVLTGPVSELSFWVKGFSTDPGNLIIEGFNGLSWETIDILQPSSKALTAIYNFAPNKNFIQFKFTFKKHDGSILIDDINMKYSIQVPFLLPGFNDKIVNDTSILVTGLKPNTTYYYRVKGENIDNISSNSNIVTFTTCGLVLSNVDVTNVDCNNNQTGAISINVTGNPSQILWTGPNSFTSTATHIRNLAVGDYHLNISSANGCIIDTTITIYQPSALQASISADPIICPGNKTTLIVNAQGGAGNYSYTLIDNNKPVLTQSSAEFTVAPGTYMVTVKDTNACTYTTSPVTIINNCTDETIFLGPNPASSQFTLYFNGSDNKEYQVTVFNSVGKKLFQSTAKSGNQIVFGKEFSAGEYIIQIIESGSKQIIKAVKL